MDDIVAIEEKPKLIPCPFCGGKPLLEGSNDVFVISCIECHAMINTIGEPMHEVIHKWNKRRADLCAITTSTAH